MSLLDEYMEEFKIYDKRTVPDGYGGYTTEWVEGAPIKAALRLDNSLEARVAEQQGVTALYTITTSKAINLQYHDVIMRVKDGTYFRITSDGDDQHTPAVASLDMRQVSAEKWSLPNG